MPVIRTLAADPADQILQGEEMRLSAIAMGVHAGVAPMMASTQVSAGEALSAWPTIAGQQNYPPMHPDYTPYTANSDLFAGTQIANNACISSSCGALVPFTRGNALLNVYTQASVLWQITGVTRDNVGTALGACRVVVLETGRIAVASAPVVAEAVSDGSGNFAIGVPLNTAYQALAYKPGSPDVAGVTLNTVTPTSA